FSLHSALAPRPLPSFPTRRSSDLAFVQALNASITIWLLFSQSLGTFVLAKQAVSTTTTIAAIVASIVWFKRSMNHHGIHVQLPRSEEHTSELQSRSDLVCRLLLEK